MTKKQSKKHKKNNLNKKSFKDNEKSTNFSLHDNKFDENIIYKTNTNEDSLDNISTNEDITNLNDSDANPSNGNISEENNKLEDGKITEDFMRYSQLKNSGNNKKAKQIRKEILSMEDQKARRKYELTMKVKNKTKKFLKSSFLILLALFTSAASIASLFVYSMVKDAPPIDPTKMNELFTENSIIYDANNNITEQIQGENSRFLIKDLDEVSPELINAFLAIEDNTFFEHSGINVKRIGGALIKNIKAGGKVEGASTITQQLVKNLYLTSQKTYKRKVQEIFYAFELEEKLSKEEILTAYFNTAYLGQGARGVKAASYTYFNKDLKDLTLAECALIAGITKYPTKYSAYKKLDVTLDEDWDKLQLLIYPQDYVPTETDKEIYKILLDKNHINSLEYDALLKGRKKVYKAVFNPNSKERQELVLRRMFELKYISQEEYDEALNEEIVINLGKITTENKSTYFNSLVKQDVIKALIKNGYTDEEAERMLYTGGLRIYSTIDQRLQSIVEKEYEDNSNFPGTFEDKDGNLQPQSAMVILDNENGQIKAMIGGRGIGGDSLYNRAIKPRQPGSSIKPLAVYLPVMEEKGLTPSSQVKDEPINRNGKVWPRNANGKYASTTTMDTAVKWSYNAAAVRTAALLGKNEREAMSNVIEYLEKVGITSIVKREDSPSKHDELYPTVLGGMTHGVSPLEMTAAYATIVNNGVYIEPTTFTKIELANGTLLLENQPKKERVYSESTAYQMNQMLQSVVNGGTGSRAKLSNMPSAGKTGTTSNQYDAWFCGFSPYYTATAWIGVDIPKRMVNGSSMAASLWKDVMQKAHNGLQKKEFKKPSDLEEFIICKETGYLVSESCKKANLTKKVSISKSRMPKKYCSEEHEEVNSDKDEENEDLKPVVTVPNNNNNSNINNNNNNNNNNSGGNNNENNSGNVTITPLPNPETPPTQPEAPPTQPEAPSTQPEVPPAQPEPPVETLPPVTE